MALLTKRFVSKSIGIFTDVQVCEEKIISRIVDVISDFFIIFGATRFNWWFEDAQEAEYGSPKEYLGTDYISGIVPDITFDQNSKYKSLEDIAFIDKFGKVITWDSSYTFYLPTRWLYEDFRQEVIDGIKKYEDMIAASKADRAMSIKEKQEKKRKLIEAAKSKLSKEELFALTGKT